MKKVLETTNFNAPITQLVLVFAFLLGGCSGLDKTYITPSFGYHPTGLAPDEAASVILNRYRYCDDLHKDDCWVYSSSQSKEAEFADFVGKSLLKEQPKLRIVPAKDFRRTTFPDKDFATAPRSPEAIIELLESKMDTLLQLGPITLPTALVILSTVVFLALERVFPGRKLPPSTGWYSRAILMNLAQLVITLATVRLWIEIFGDLSIFRLSGWHSPLLEGFVGWFVGTFFFYWWHRLRHAKGWWLVFHQIHHSPSRIELLTSFYKHPVEVLSDAILSAVVLYPLLGCSLMGAFWYNFFAATGEYFYHANVRTPHWLRHFIQTPELHSIHHQFDVHKYNFSDIPLWDRIFGTYEDTTEFVDRCGFPNGAEEKLIPMLAFEDVYYEDAS